MIADKYSEGILVQKCRQTASMCVGILPVMRSSKKKPDVQRIAKHDWHALPIAAVEEALGVNRNGLTEEEVTHRKRTYGPNRFSKGKRETVFDRIFEQFKSPLTVILLLSCVITFALEEYIDTSVIAFALLIAVVVGVIQEGKASRAFEKLSSSQVKHATVIRGGKRHELEANELLPGDLVVLQSGMQVPADLRLIQTKKLSINEATLTGEWLAVKKGTERIPVGTPLAELSSMAWMGTFVAEGHGMGYVVATGDDTAVGDLAKQLSEIVDETTPVQREMGRISRVMLVILVILIAAIFLIGVATGKDLQTMLLTSIAIAVASIPEGLPAAVTIVLAVGMEALLKRGGLVRNLLAAETLGSTTYVLTDKTGTLTEGRMAVTDAAYIGCTQEGSRTCDWDDDDRARRLFNIALCASDAFLDEHTDGNESYIVRGEPMERAILEGALSIGITLSGETLRGTRKDYLSFTSENRFAAGVATENGEHILCINGAPEYLLEHATHVVTNDGVSELSEEHRRHFEDVLETSTKEGKRLMGVAYKTVTTPDVPETDAAVLRGTTFAGFLIFHDPVRDGVDKAIRGVIKAGAQVRLVTGDNPETALTIARAAGVAHTHDVALTGNDIAELDDDELLEALRTTRVFARVLPRQKMRLARVLQTSGEIVAMTGDGVNDAPALQKANIGVAVGSGTEVAKEASDLVLVNDSFETIYAAIEEGRRIISNLRKIVGYLISTSLSEAVLIAGALVTAAPIPILPAQILWANIIEEGLMSVAFAFEKGDRNVMKDEPKDIHEEGVLSREVLLFVLGVVGVLSILILSLYAYLRMIGLPIEDLRSIMFLAISIDSLFIAFSFRSLTMPLWRIPLRDNLFFFGSFVLNFVLLGIVITVPFMQYLLSYTPQPLSYIGLALLYGFSTMVVVEIGKWLIFERKRR